MDEEVAPSSFVCNVAAGLSEGTMILSGGGDSLMNGVLTSRQENPAIRQFDVGFTDWFRYLEEVKTTDNHQTTVATASFSWIFLRGWAADLGFWIAYGMLWHLVFSPATTVENLAISGILTFWQAVASYSHIRFLLVPRGKGAVSVWVYGLGIIFLIFLFGSLSGVSLYAFFLTFLPSSATDGFFDYWVEALIGGMSTAVASTGGIYLFGRRREQEKRQAELEKARADAELAFLRGQLNPHFLFNALNSIYVLISQSPHEAQTALGGFSDLLRYQLYRAQEDVVPLKEELDQLQQFADLSRLRLEEDFLFALQIPKSLNGESVPPMLLLPLVENALKYSPKQGGKVTGIVDIKDGRLGFTLSNNTSKLTVVDPDASGIGLSNIRRRLKLLFPGDHHFSTSHQDGHFTVNLEIPLS